MAPHYNPITSSRPLMLRRMAFLLFQAMQLAYLLLYTTALYPKHLRDIPWTLSCILFFFFVAWNLHIIVGVQGTRVVYGRRVGRRAFDVLLWGLVVAEGGLLTWRACGGHEWDIKTAGVVVDLVIFGGAWVGTWEADGGVLLG